MGFATIAISHGGRDDDLAKYLRKLTRHVVITLMAAVMG